MADSLSVLMAAVMAGEADGSEKAQSASFSQHFSVIGISQHFLFILNEQNVKKKEKNRYTF